MPITREKEVMVNRSEDESRAVVKQAVVEALEECRDLFLDVVTEVLEDLALTEAIKDASQSEEVARSEVLAILRGQR